MKNLILVIYPVAIIFIAFFGAKIAEKGKFAEDHLSLKQSKMIQALACLLIIIHHITQKITGYGVIIKGPVTIFNYLGIFFTAIFFFFSGYGLMTSLYEKQDYLDNFLKKRLPSVLIPFWIINTLGVILHSVIYGYEYTAGEALSDIFGLTLVNSNGWFIIEIGLFYLLFYIFFKYVKNKDVALTLLIVAVFIVIRYSFFRGHDTDGSKAHWFRGEWWYNSTVTFALGLLYARFKDKIEKFCHRFYPVLLSIMTFLSLLAIGVSTYVVNRYGYYNNSAIGIWKHDASVTLLVQSISCLVTTFFVILLSMKISIGNKAIGYLSGISMELFLIHGYFVNRIFSNVMISDFLVFAVNLASSIAFTALVSPGIKKATAWVVSLLNTKREIRDTIEARIAEEKRRKRNKTIKIGALILIILCAAYYLYAVAGRYITAGKEYEQERKALYNARIGDEVLWGRYNTNNKTPGRERLEWIVIDRLGDDIYLITKYGIASSSYNVKHEEISWEASDLRAKLNSPESLQTFSRYEIEDIKELNGDLVTLLTADEAERYFESDKARELIATEAAEAQGVNTDRFSIANLWDMNKNYHSSWWWLKGERNKKAVTAPIVTVDGEISLTEKEVNRPGGAVRPVIWVKVTE